MYRFCPKWLYNLHEFGDLDEINFFLENSEADVNMLVSHRAPGGCACQERMLTSPRHLTPYTSGICRRLCKPNFFCGLFHLPDLDMDLDCWYMYSVYLTGHIDFDCGLLRLPDLDTSILTIEFCALNGAHGGCDRSTGDAYSLTPDPTSGFSRGPCLLNFLDLYCIRDLWLITVC
jgi:hypothetical protein